MTISERIDAITQMPPRRLHTVVAPPKSVKIELTARCNFACAFCARSMKLRDQKDMDRKLFERLTVELRDEGVEELGLFYLGESFLLDWLPQAVHFAKNIVGFPYVFLTTNGSLATPEKVRGCIEARLDSLKFSLNYADEDQFKEIARVKGKLFHDLLDHIKDSWYIREDVKSKTGHHCGLYASYIAYDGDQGKRMADLIDMLKPYLDEIYALPLYSHGGFATEEEKARGWAPTAGNRGRLAALRDPLPCWAMFTEGHISWNGMLTGCCFAHTPDFDFGDLKEVPFMQAWNSDKAQWFRAAHLKKDIKGTPCEGCVAAE